MKDVEMICALFEKIVVVIIATRIKLRLYEKNL